MARNTGTIGAEELQTQRRICAQIAEYWQVRRKEPLAWVDTYGCQQNENDSERIRGMLKECGYRMIDSEENADVIVINTCAVREHANQRVFGNIGALVHGYRRHPGQIICLCGCMAGQPEVVERLKKSFPHVRVVFTSHELWRFPELLQRALLSGKRIFATEPSDGNIAEGLPVLRSNGLKGWLSIMYGCNNFCSYCIVPYVRGRERSRQPEDILAEAREMIDAGYRDITLLGQNVNSYGRDLDCGVDFADLLAQLAQLDGEFVLRFMTSHPKDASRKLFDTMARYPKIAKVIHLPVQAGNNRVLREMNRRYTAAQYLELIEYARSVMPEIVLTSDIIVGFPGETDEEFEDTLKLVEQVRYDALFTFIYSPREGTPAAKMPDPFSREQKQRNFDRLVAAQNRISDERHQEYVGKVLRCLIDGVDEQDPTLLTARTDGNRLVRLPGDPGLVGQFRPVEITGSGTWSLNGKLAE